MTLSWAASTIVVQGPRLRRAILLAAVFGIPVFFLKGVTVDPFNVPKLALLFIALGVVVASRAAEAFLGSSWRPVPLGLPATALTLPLLVAWVASPYRSWGVFGAYPRFQGLVPYAAVVLLGLLLSDAFRERRLQLAWALASAGGVVGAYAFVQSLGLDPIRTWMHQGSPVMSNASTIGHTNFTGGFFAIVLPLCVYLWVEAPRGRRLALAFTVLSAEGLIVSNSQGGWAAGAAGIALVGGALASRRWPRARSLGVVVAGAMACIVVGSVLLSMVAPRLSIVGGSIGARGVYWQTATEMAARSPLVGRGPNSYALEGVRYRPVEDSVLVDYASADDPHSVPLSFLANAGVLGLGGYVLFAAWVVHAGLRAARRDALGAAFFAAAAAYLVQSLVSIDEPVLRVALWTSLAGMTASIPRGFSSARAPVGSASGFAILGAVLVAGLLFVGTAWWTVGWIRADHLALRGIELFEAGRPGGAVAAFGEARSFRDEYHYRALEAEGLGRIALERGPSGWPLIADLRTLNAYLDHFPKSGAVLAAARTFHHWGHYSPPADDEALALYRRGLKLDPNNVLARAETAEVLIDLGRPEQAVALLEPLEAQLAGMAEHYWGALSVARLEVGDLPGARRALEEARSVAPVSCSVRIADESIRVASLGPSYRPRLEAVLNLQLACGRGTFLWFLDRLPADARVLYEAPTLAGALAGDAE